MNLSNTTLYYKDGSSDKVYQCSIEKSGPKYTVDFAYGRRGSSLKTGTKTSSPVVLDEAEKIYHSLIREKTSKGYTPGEDRVKYTAPELDKKPSGYNVQLLNSIEESEVQVLIHDMKYCAQEKWNGERMVLGKKYDEVFASNKLGLIRAFPLELTQYVSNGYTYDGELVGDIYRPFDVLEYAGKDVRENIYFDRVNRLPSCGGMLRTQFQPVETAFTTVQKQLLYDRLKKEGREGIVFKLMSAPYAAGRPASGGSQLKFKFCATASCTVIGINKKRSVRLGVLDGVRGVEIGNVTIPPNKDIPMLGDVVEIRYLYAYRMGSLFQPIYLGTRNDVTIEECSINQLKYKSEE